MESTFQICAGLCEESDEPYLFLQAPGKCLPTESPGTVGSWSSLLGTYIFLTYIFLFYVFNYFKKVLT